MQDLQLALVISRLYESEFETSSTYKKILQRHVLGQDKQVTACVRACQQHTPVAMFDYSTLPVLICFIALAISCVFQIPVHPDPFLRSISYWVLEDYSKALDTLIEQPSNCKSSGPSESKCDGGTYCVTPELSLLFSSFFFLYRKTSCINNIKFV